MPKDQATYSPDEAQRRFEQALKAAVTTPPVPMKDRASEPHLAEHVDPSERATPMPFEAPRRVR